MGITPWLLDWKLNYFIELTFLLKVCMAKKIKSASPFTKYFRELSIVIIGVLITLMITNLISYKTKQKEVDRAMDLIKTEMEENLVSLGKTQQKFETEQRIYKLILAHINNLEEISADTLHIYKRVIGDKHSLSVESDSYDVFKSSLLMQYIKDKNFLRELSKTYGMIEGLRDKLIYYSKIKSDGLNHLMEEYT